MARKKETNAESEVVKDEVVSTPDGYVESEEVAKKGKAEPTANDYASLLGETLLINDVLKKVYRVSPAYVTSIYKGEMARYGSDKVKILNVKKDNLDEVVKLFQTHNSTFSITGK